MNTIEIDTKEGCIPESYDLKGPDWYKFEDMVSPSLDKSFLENLPKSAKEWQKRIKLILWEIYNKVPTKQKESFRGILRIVLELHDNYALTILFQELALKKPADNITFYSNGVMHKTGLACRNLLDELNKNNPYRAQ